MNLSFDDEFNSLSLNMDTTGTANGTWDTYFSGWGTRSLTGNGEQEVYVDPSLAGTSGSALGLNPFSDKNGVLTITAAPTPSQDLSSLWNMPYTSGLLNTQTSFSQTYGYFEIRAQLPAGGQGLWPAFWLLPENNSWPPEIDVFEQVDNPSSPILSTIHDASGNTSQSFNVGNTSAEYHTYGVLWTSQAITFYVDGQKMGSVPTPADYNQPMYMLMNLAVGGSWPGSPDSSTNWSAADMKVDYVRAYSLTNTAMAAPNTISTAAGTVSAGTGTTSTSSGSAAGSTSQTQTSGTSTSSGSGQTTSSSTGSTAATSPGKTSSSGAGTSTGGETHTAADASSPVRAIGASQPTHNVAANGSVASGSSSTNTTPSGGAGSNTSALLAGAHATVTGFQPGQGSTTVPSGGSTIPVTGSAGTTSIALGNSLVHVVQAPPMSLEHL